MQSKSMYLAPINKLLRQAIEMGFKARAERDIDAEIQRTAMKLRKQVGYEINFSQVDSFSFCYWGFLWISGDQRFFFESGGGGP